MALTARIDRAVRYACAVCSDLQISRLPVDPLSLGQIAGISVVPYSAVLTNAGWFPGDLPGRMQMNPVLTLTYPAFCIVWRDDIPDPDRLRGGMTFRIRTACVFPCAWSWATCS